MLLLLSVSLPGVDASGSCFNGVLDGDETCVDGGGSCANLCGAEGSRCAADSDCASSSCFVQSCADLPVGSASGLLEPRDNGVVVEATCDGNWTLIDPSVDSAWLDVFALNSTEYYGVLGPANDPATTSLQQWVGLHDVEFRPSADCVSVIELATAAVRSQDLSPSAASEDEMEHGYGYSMTGSYFDCSFNNGDCPQLGTQCQNCDAGPGECDHWVTWANISASSCIATPTSHAPSIGTLGAYCVAYQPFDRHGGCAAPSCSDGIRNSGEACVDGGVDACGSTCANETSCFSDADCASGICLDETCRAYCGAPAESPEGGSWNGTDAAFLSGDVLTALCPNAGWAINGSTAIRCLASGLWNSTAAPICVGPPTPPTVLVIAGDGWLNVTWTTSDELLKLEVWGQLQGPGALAAGWLFQDGLVNGQQYGFQVTATNGYGSTTKDVLATPHTLPHPPTHASATGGRSLVNVTWVAPQEDGGSAVTEFLVECLPAGSLSVDGALTFAAVPVANNVSTTCTVSAVTAAGASNATSAGGAVVAYDVPAAPQNLTVARRDAAFVASWTAPEDNACGAAVTAYLLTDELSGETMAVEAATAAEWSPATNGQAYNVTVRALNVAGAGPAWPARAVTPAGVPCAPTALQLWPSPGALNVSWTPACDNGAPILGTQVNVSSGLTTTTLDSWLLVTGLVDGTAYAVSVAAVNDVGRGVVAAAEGAPASVPDAPAIDRTATSDGVVQLWWTAGDDGGANITAFVVTSSTGTKVSTGSTYAALSVDNGVAQSFTVAARNVVGLGASSSSTVQLTARSPVSVELQDPLATPLVGASEALPVIFVAATPPEQYLIISISNDLLHLAEGSLNLTAGMANVTGHLTFDVRGQHYLSMEFAGPQANEYTIGSAAMAVDCAVESKSSFVNCTGCAPEYFWNFDSLSCDACPEGAVCAGDFEAPQPLAGYYSAQRGVVFSCLPHEACLGSFGTDVCRVGYRGDRCAYCSDGYYRVAGLCIQCSDTTLLDVIVLCVVFVLLGIPTLFVTWRKVNRRIAAYPSLQLVSPMMAMLVDYMQLLSLFGSAEYWPRSTRQGLTHLRVSRPDPDYLAVECTLGWSYEARYAVVMAIPVAVLLAAAVVWREKLKNAIWPRVHPAVRKLVEQIPQHIPQLWPAMPRWVVKLTGSRASGHQYHHDDDFDAATLAAQQQEEAAAAAAAGPGLQAAFGANAAAKRATNVFVKKQQERKAQKKQPPLPVRLWQLGYRTVTSEYKEWRHTSHTRSNGNDTRVFVTLMNFFYIIVVAKALEPIDCLPVGQGVSVMRVDPSMVCASNGGRSTAAVDRLWPWAVLLFVVYGLVTPILTSGLLWRALTETPPLLEREKTPAVEEFMWHRQSSRGNSSMFEMLKVTQQQHIQQERAAVLHRRHSRLLMGGEDEDEEVIHQLRRKSSVAPDDYGHSQHCFKGFNGTELLRRHYSLVVLLRKGIIAWLTAVLAGNEALQLVVVVMVVVGCWAFVAAYSPYVDPREYVRRRQLLKGDIAHVVPFHPEAHWKLSLVHEDAAGQRVEQQLFAVDDLDDLPTQPPPPNDDFRVLRFGLPILPGMGHSQQQLRRVVAAHRERPQINFECNEQHESATRVSLVARTEPISALLEPRSQGAHVWEVSVLPDPAHAEASWEALKEGTEKALMQHLECLRDPPAGMRARLPRCLVLNVRRSLAMAASVARHFDFVICWSGAPPEAEHRQFMAAFYARLCMLATPYEQCKPDWEGERCYAVAKGASGEGSTDFAGAFVGARDALQMQGLLLGHQPMLLVRRDSEAGPEVADDCEQPDLGWAVGGGPALTLQPRSARGYTTGRLPRCDLNWSEFLQSAGVFCLAISSLIFRAADFRYQWQSDMLRVLLVLAILMSGSLLVFYVARSIVETLVSLYAQSHEGHTPAEDLRAWLWGQAREAGGRGRGRGRKKKAKAPAAVSPSG